MIITITPNSNVHEVVAVLRAQKGISIKSIVKLYMEAAKELLVAGEHDNDNFKKLCKKWAIWEKEPYEWDDKKVPNYDEILIISYALGLTKGQTEAFLSARFNASQEVMCYNFAKNGITTASSKKGKTNENII